MAQGDETHGTASGRATLDARVETQTLYLMEMMRRLGASTRAAQDEAARIAARAPPVACGEKAACATFPVADDAARAPPGFCANGDYLGGGRVH